MGDQRDGPCFSGWRFGPKIGGDQVWAYHASQAQTPPKSGWKVPYDGPVDSTFILSKADAAASQQNALQQLQQQQLLQLSQQLMQNPQAAQQSQSNQGGYGGGYNSAEKEKRRKQQEEHNKTKMEEMKKQQEEQKASIGIRRVIMKVCNTATPENFDELKKELETVIQSDLPNCGGQKERVLQEVQQGVEKAQTRVAQIVEQ